MSNPTIVIYHAHCADGFAAAWVAHQAFPDAQFHPMSYGDDLPEIPDRSTVYILDFSLPRDTMIGLNERLGTENVTLLDHHQSAVRALAGLPNCHFDMGRSGAMIAWEHFFPHEPVPQIIRYVQDRDLWTWALPSSRAVNAWIASWAAQTSFARWDDMAQQMERQLSDVVSHGENIVRATETLVHQAADSAVITEIDGHQVPMATCPVLMSEIGERLLELHPEAPFAAVRVHEENEDRYSLRSRQDGHNVAETAQKFSGGGHPAAAGFRQAA